MRGGAACLLCLRLNVCAAFDHDVALSRKNGHLHCALSSHRLFAKGHVIIWGGGCKSSNYLVWRPIWPIHWQYSDFGPHDQQFEYDKTDYKLWVLFFQPKGKWFAVRDSHDKRSPQHVRDFVRPLCRRQSLQTCVFFFTNDPQLLCCAFSPARSQGRASEVGCSRSERLGRLGLTLWRPETLVVCPV